MSTGRGQPLVRAHVNGLSTEVLGVAVIWLDQFKRDRLVPELAAELQERGSVVRRIEHVDDVDVWRQAARRAGRLLGWRVRSGISRSAAGDAVWVTSDDFEVTEADLRESGRRVSARLDHLIAEAQAAEAAKRRPRLLR
jgi:hypothetical protein